MSILIRGGILVELGGPTVERGDLRISEGLITGRGTALELEADEELFDASGHLVFPGLVVAHTHLYSALARGMPSPPVTPTNFPEILEQVWWVLDRSLEMIRYSGLVGALAAARCGVTTLVDHHASPCAIEGSLAALRGALDEVGLRGVLCYEVTERGTPEQFEAGMAEALRGDLFGIHAAFTLTDQGLARCGEAARAAGMSCHIHVAEDPCDLRGGSSSALVDRLDNAGLLIDGTVLAHLIHLEDAQIDRVAAAGCWTVHNARSNMNNHVGHARPSRFPERKALGTDGIDGDILAEAKAAWYKARDGGDPLAFDAARAMLHGGQRLVGGGSLEVGGRADIALLAYDPPTPLNEENLDGHLIFGIASSTSTSTA